jgi:hypothetical protein
LAAGAQQRRVIDHGGSGSQEFAEKKKTERRGDAGGSARRGKEGTRVCLDLDLLLLGIKREEGKVVVGMLADVCREGSRLLPAPARKTT